MEMQISTAWFHSAWPKVPLEKPPYIHTCVCEIDHGEEDHASSKRDPEEEECLELLPGQPVLQVLQEGVGLEKCKHT